MKQLLTLIIILYCNYGYGQTTIPSNVYVLDKVEDIGHFIGADSVYCDTTKLDTVQVALIIGDTTIRYNYYNQNGSLRWGNVKYLDSTLLGMGGWIETYYLHPEMKRIIGYIVLRPNEFCIETIIATYGGDMKPIKKPFAVIQKPPLPKQGF